MLLALSQSLWLVDCRRLDDLSPLAALPSLSVLTLTSCRAARDLSPLLHIQQLSALTLDSCFARDLSPLAGHQTLQDLHLAYDCWSVMSLKLPSSLPSLRRMRIMSSIYDLSPLACFTGLEVGFRGVTAVDLCQAALRPSHWKAASIERQLAGCGQQHSSSHVHWCVSAWPAASRQPPPVVGLGSDL